MGAIKILSAQSYKGGTRLAVVCGERAHQSIAAAWQDAAAVGTLLSSAPGRLLPAVPKPTNLAEASLNHRLAAMIWLDVIFGGLFLADLIVSAIQAVGFSKQLARIDELRKAMRTTSDALTEVIGTSAMTMDTLLDEQKLQLTLAAMEGATNAAELRDQLRELAGKAGTLRDTTIRLSKQRFFGTGRLLRAFPDMVPDRREALASLRVGLTKATARAKAAAKQAVKTGKNMMSTTAPAAASLLSGWQNTSLAHGTGCRQGQEKS